MEIILVRNGFAAASIQIGDGAGLGSLLALIGRPDKPVAAVMVPSLDHLEGRLAEITARVAVWTMYPPQCWEATDYDRSPHRAEIGQRPQPADAPQVEPPRRPTDPGLSESGPAPKRRPWLLQW
jgi:hypothetical protein